MAYKQWPTDIVMKTLFLDHENRWGLCEQLIQQHNCHHQGWLHTPAPMCQETDLPQKCFTVENQVSDTNPWLIYGTSQETDFVYVTDIGLIRTLIMDVLCPREGTPPLQSSSSTKMRPAHWVVRVTCDGARQELSTSLDDRRHIMNPSHQGCPHSATAGLHSISSADNWIDGIWGHLGCQNLEPK